MKSTFTLVTLGFVAAVLTLVSGTARAYPQFQMSRDQTCTGCHFSPAGGGLLNENGLATAEGISQFGTAPEFFYGKIPTPGFLALGGDLRAATGYVASPEKLATAFPMQADVYARAALPAGLSVYVNVGARPPQVGNENTTFAWSREHFVTWQQNPGENNGLYVRLGRFMPVFGLRFVEHPIYTRRLGGTPLYGETYGLAVEYVQPKYEVHVTGFIKDPIIDTPEHSNGAAAIAEYRLTERFSVGAETMYTQSVDDKKIRVGAVGKLLLPFDTLLQFEGQFMNQLIEPRGAPKQIVAYLLASKPLDPGLLIDVGLGYFNENVAIKQLDREAFDLNFHWFATSHVELIFTGRLEMLAFGSGGSNAGYALGQLHYRL